MDRLDTNENNIMKDDEVLEDIFKDQDNLSDFGILQWEKVGLWDKIFTKKSVSSLVHADCSVIAFKARKVGFALLGIEMNGIREVSNDDIEICQHCFL